MGERDPVPSGTAGAALPEAYRAALDFIVGAVLPRCAAVPRPADLEPDARRGGDGKFPPVPPPLRKWVLAREFQALHPAVMTLAPLVSPRDGLAAVVLARAIFETVLDLELLACDGSGESVRQYLAYGEVLRHQAAEKLVQFEDRIQPPGDRRATLPRGIASATGARARVDARVREVWGLTRKGTPRYPEHWSGLRTSQRIDALAAHRPGAARKLETIYREGYFRAALAWAAGMDAASPLLGGASARPAEGERVKYPPEGGRGPGGATPAEGGDPEWGEAVNWHRRMAFEMHLLAAATCATALDVLSAGGEGAGELGALADRPGEFRLG